VNESDRLQRLEAIRERLFKRPSLFEAFGVLLSFGLSLGMIYLYHYVDPYLNPADFSIFYNTTAGRFNGFYYMHWAIFMFYPLAALGNYWLAYVIWNLINTLGIVFAARVFGGRAGVALISYQMMFAVYYGQIAGVIVAGLAWYWWFMLQRKPLIAGIGAIFALIKPQLGFPLLIAIGMTGDDKWRNRIVSSLPVFGIFALSLLTFGNWTAEWFARFSYDPPNTLASITLWDYVGPTILVLWIPAILLPMDAESRLIIIAAASSLAVPYYQQTGLISIYVLPVGWLGLLGNLGFLMAFGGFAALEWLIIVPIIAYVWMVYRSIRQIRQFGWKPKLSVAP
jgi:hypothetical protein